ncbi:unnamed protein product [Dicrocoelium dendriticum]|nr:unnamed protein product [Dicrocoelium dendriticum]
MSCNNTALDPEVLDFYYPDRSKSSRCTSSHHPSQQPLQRIDTGRLWAQQHALQSGSKHMHITCDGVASHQISAPRFTTSGKAVHGQLPLRNQPGSEYQYHHGAQRYRSSVSPVQALSSTCGSTSSTLTSSSGYRTGTSVSLSSAPQRGHKPATSLRAVNLIGLLKEKIALLPGGRSRRGGPLLCFPSNSRADEISFEDLCLLVWYLSYLPEERVKKLGFSVIVDMRYGTTWHSVKPILKVVEKCIGSNVTITYIIKPDKIIEKHKANMAIGKFSFEIQLVSMETLFREVDPSQLTAELDGSLPYQHDEWIQIRCCLEEFFFTAQDMSDKFSHLFFLLDRKLELDTVDTSKRALEDHRSLRLKVVQAPVSALEAEADRLTTWLRYGVAAANSVTSVSPSCSSSQTHPVSNSTTPGHCQTPGGGASFLATSWVSMNPDFQQLIPQVRQTVTKLYEFRAHLQQKWETGRSRLEQIYQLRLFEEDANRMATWLGRQRQLFLTEYLDIGQNASHAADLLTEHRQFVDGCSVAFEQIARLTGVAGMLADVGHFASQQILKQAGQLEHEWKSFVAALEDRSRVLYLSASFHARAQSFLGNCPHRESAMLHVDGNSVHELHQALLTLQSYWQEAQTARDEVCEDGRALTNHLSAPIPTGSHTSLTAAVDYSQGRKHCTDLVHEIWAWFKQLERVYNERKLRLNCRLSVLMFKEDVGQVLAWLSDHGEPFLQRQTSVGKSITRAEQLYNTHMQFEQVAAKTLVNAEKLISVADELASQADDPEEVLQKATELQHRISAFTRAVEARRETVDLGCGFYSHTKEILTWLHCVREGYNPGEHLPATIEGMEDELTTFHRDRTAIEEGADRVSSEGEALVTRLKDIEEIAHVQSVLAQVSSERAAVSTLQTERQLRLDLCLQLRLFEADVNSALDCLRHKIPSFSLLASNRVDNNSLNTTGSSLTARPQSPCSSGQPSWISDLRQAPNIGALEEVSSVCLSVLPTAEEVLHKGAELLRAFESVGVNFPAGGPGSSDSGVGDSVESAIERVHRLSNELSEAVAVVDELNERISGELDWRRLQAQSEQVLNWINQCQEILRETSVIPTTLAEAQALQAEHEKFQPVLNDAHPQAVQCTARASMLLQQAAANSSSLSTSTVGGEHPHRKDYRAVAEAVADHWQKLVYAAEDRHKLLIAATNWYKTSNQVTNVLFSLEKEYRREEDWCQSEKAGTDTSAYLAQLSLKHAEQKEAFLKACMLARRTSDVFSRYLHRQSTGTKGRLEVEEKIRTAINELMTKEQAVLEAWAVRRRRLDDCTYFINIKRQVEELLTRVYSQSQDKHSQLKVPATLTVNTQLGSSLIQEVNRACDSLDSMISASMPLSPGHTIQLKALLKRLQETLPPPSPVDPCNTTCKAACSNEAHRPAKADYNISSSFPASTHADPSTPRTKRPEAETDRTSISSTSSSGAYSSTTAGGNDMFLVPPTGTTATANAAVTGLTQEQRRMIRRRENLLQELIQTERTYIQALEQCLDTYRNGLISPPQPFEAKVPPGLVGMADVVFGNIPAIYDFHKLVFEPELGKYTEGGGFLPEDVGHCFVIHSERLAELYIEYCVNHTESTRLVIEHGQSYFQLLQHHYKLLEPLQSYLIKPVQRVTKYQLLLRELRDCCDPASVAELTEGLDAMLDVPKRANDALHLSMLQGLPENLPVSTLGDVILQDQFIIWEPKQLIKKSRERRVFLFDHCLLLAKEIPTQPGEHKAKYHYKSRLLLAECNITEHIEGDQCKFALWTGRVPPVQEYRMVLRAATLEMKQIWVRALREVMRERMFCVQSLYQHQQNIAPGKPGTLNDEAEMLDTYYILENYQATNPKELSVSAHQIVHVLYRCHSQQLPSSQCDDDEDKSAKMGSGEWTYIRMLTTGMTTSVSSPIKEGFIPSRLIGAPSGRRRTVSTTSNRRSSTAIRKWLPVGTDARRGTAGIALPNKRGSKADMHEPQAFPAPYPTSVPRVTSTGYQPPHSHTNQSVSNSGAAVLDNVSEESMDVELPPPMQELQVLPTKTVVAETDQTSTPIGPSIEELVHDLSRPLVTEHRMTETPHQTCTVSETLKTNFRLATIAEVAGDGGSAPCTVPTLVGLPVGTNLSALGNLRLHGSLSVAAKLVAGTRLGTNGSQLLTGPDEEMLRGVLDEGAELHFTGRHFFLYDKALVISDAAVELLDSCNAAPNPLLQCEFRHALSVSQISILEDINALGSTPTDEHFLWFCISERARNLSVPSPFDSSSDSACASSLQSYLCYVVAPRSPDTRVRWLTELNAMVTAARRSSHAFPLPSSYLHVDDSNSFASPSQQRVSIAAASAALYPSGLWFDPKLLDLPRLGRLPAFPTSSSPDSKQLTSISSSASTEADVCSVIQEHTHLAFTSTS